MKPSQGESIQNPYVAAARALAEILKTCPHCKQGLSGHEFAQFATWVVPKENDGTVQTFFQAIKDRDWTKLLKFQNWEPRSDDIEAYVVRCPKQQFSVVVTKTHFELLQGSRLLFCESLLVEEGEKLVAAFPSLNWHAFQILPD